MATENENNNNNNNNENDDNTNNENQNGNNERPEWLPEKFKTVEDMVNSYNQLEQKLHKGNDNKGEGDNDNNDNFDPFADFNNNSSDDSSNPKNQELSEYFSEFNDLGFDIADLINDVSENKINPEHKRILEEKIGDKKKIKEFIDKSKEAANYIKDFETKIENVFKDVFKDHSDDVTKFFENPENAEDPAYAPILQDYVKAVESNDLKSLKVATQALKVAYEKNENPLISDDSVLSRINKFSTASRNGDDEGSIETYSDISDYHKDLKKATKASDYAELERIDKKFELSKRYKKI